MFMIWLEKSHLDSNHQNHKRFKMTLIDLSISWDASDFLSPFCHCKQERRREEMHNKTQVINSQDVK